MICNGYMPKTVLCGEKNRRVSRPVWAENCDIFFYTVVFETYIVNKTLNFIVDLPETVRIWRITELKTLHGNGLILRSLQMLDRWILDCWNKWMTTQQCFNMYIYTLSRFATDAFPEPHHGMVFCHWTDTFQTIVTWTGGEHSKEMGTGR